MPLENCWSYYCWLKDKAYGPVCFGLLRFRANSEKGHISLFKESFIIVDISCLFIAMVMPAVTLANRLKIFVVRKLNIFHYRQGTNNNVIHKKWDAGCTHGLGWRDFKQEEKKYDCIYTLLELPNMKSKQIW